MKNTKWNRRTARLSSLNHPVLIRAFTVVACGAIILGMIFIKRPVQPTFLANPYRPQSDSVSPGHAEAQRKIEIGQRFKQGVAMLQIGQYAHAVTAFHRVLALDPLLPEAHINIGFAFYETGDFSGSERFFRGATALAPHLSNAWYGLGIALFAQGHLLEAKNSLEKFVAMVDTKDIFRGKALDRIREVEMILASEKQSGVHVEVKVKPSPIGGKE